MIRGFFINLDRSIARRAHIERLAEAANVCFTRLEAVDGLSLSDEEYERVHPFMPNQRRMTKSEVACFLSHRKAWLEICRLDADHGAVFEDDIDFGSALGAILAEESWLRPEMDLIKLDKATRKHVEFGESVLIFPGLDVRRMLSLHVGCGGYILSKAFAQNLVEKTTVFNVPIDHFLFNPVEGILGHARIWQTQPAVCIHQQFSDAPFLPNEAELSSLQSTRKAQIKLHQKQFGGVSFLVRKLGREISRPFISLFRIIYAKVVSVSQGRSWQRVGFKRDR